jgi:hypothetical protein
VLGTTGGSMPGAMRLTFLVCLAAVALVFVTLCWLELTAKAAGARLRRLQRRTAAPAVAPALSPPRRRPRAEIPQVLH